MSTAEELKKKLAETLKGRREITIDVDEAVQNFIQYNNTFNCRITPAGLAINISSCEINTTQIVENYFNNIQNINLIYDVICYVRKLQSAVSVHLEHFGRGITKIQINNDMQKIFNILYKHYTNLGPNYKLTDEQKEVFRFLLNGGKNKFWLYTALSDDNNINFSSNVLRSMYKEWIIKREEFDNFVKEIGLDDNSISYHKSNRDRYELSYDSASRVGQRWKANINSSILKLKSRASNFLKSSNEPTGEQSNVPTGVQTNIPTDEQTNVPTDEQTNVPTDEQIVKIGGKKQNKSKKSKKSKKRRYSKRR
jgi:hypothetical protein